MTKHIGHNALAVPSRMAVDICIGCSFQYDAANIAVISNAIAQALWLAILNLLKEIMSQKIGSIASIKLINTIYHSIIRGNGIID